MRIEIIIIDVILYEFDLIRFVSIILLIYPK